jgi:hypothetical protein
VIGFVICFWIWLSVSSLAMKVGAVWGCLGMIYLVMARRRQRGPLAESPPP